MKAGRELDALVAITVMGWKVDDRTVDGRVYDWYIDPKGSFRLADEIPFYSVDIAVAWRIVDRLLEMRGEDGHYHKECFIMNVSEEGMGDLVRWSSAHAAHIICIAAVRAFGVEV